MLIRSAKGARKALLAMGFTLSMGGCIIGKRIDRFTDSFGTEFYKEYKQRTDPNIGTSDRYSSLRKIGELQLKVEQRILTRREARQLVEKGDIDKAFDAVQAIARGAAQDALRQSNPEAELVEQFTTLGTGPGPSDRELASDELTDILKPELRLSTSLSDVLKPGLRLGSSISHGDIEFEPTVKLGSIYAGSYSTKNESFSHILKYRYDRWAFRLDVDHGLKRFHRVSCNIGYTVDQYTSLTLSYTYDKRIDEHFLSFGLIRTW